MQDLIAWAKQYAAKGYRVFPTQGKQPVRGFKWKDNATTNPKVIEKIFRTGNGVGILPGEDVVVFDIDNPEEVPVFLDAFPELRKAPRSLTPRGGAHIYCKVNPGLFKTRNKTDIGGVAVDIKGLGKGYLVEAPAPNYKWEIPL
tara:strand:+ start:2340 stop:2771 length:432 start_codon:yes stop_codon:yes gene_type:complete